MHDHGDQHQTEANRQGGSAVAHRQHECGRGHVAFLDRIIDGGIKQTAKEHSGQQQAQRRHESLLRLAQASKKHRQAQMLVAVDGDRRTQHGQP